MVATRIGTSTAVAYDGKMGRRSKTMEARMRTVLVIDEKLLEEARRLTGLKETNAVMREALRALIERESARRLANLGGSEPRLTEISRRRSETT